MTAIAQRTASVHPTPLPVFRRWLSEGWRGLIGWGLLLLGLAFHIVRFGLKPPSDPDRRR